ncbi:MAG: Clostripain precursor [bacterium ADurb.Bin363]|nr:MAG: Clostripain precursor [bacterium ADurb.Bin363]
MNIGRVNSEKVNIPVITRKESSSEDVSIQKDQVIIGSAEPKEITFLNYLDGSNNLESYIMQNLKDMEQVGSTKNMNIVAQLSRFQVPPLTKFFFGEALKQVITNESFGQLLVEETKDPHGVAEFQEMFKNPRMAGYISENILSSSPPLMQGITEMVTGLTTQVLGDEDMVDLFTTLAYQLAQEMLKSDKEEKGSVTMSLGNSEQNEVNRLSIHMMNAIKKFISEKMNDDKILYVDAPYTGGSLLKAKDKDFVPDNEPEWLGARRYFVTKGDDPSRINSKVVEDLEFVNMGKPKTLTDFLVWGIKNFPAKKYVVLCSDHGAGFVGGFEDREEMMTLPQINEALAEAEKQTGVKPDVLIFDCCLMAQAEVGYELKDRAKIMVASEETVGGMGMPYVNMLNNMDKLAEEGMATPENIAKGLIAECDKTSDKSTITFSAIDLTKMDEMRVSIDNLAEALMKTGTDKKTIKFILKNTTSYSQSSPSAPYRDFRDLGHLADNILTSSDITDLKLKEAAREVKKALSEAVVAEEHIKDDEDYVSSQGMTIYGPGSSKYMNEKLYNKYKDTAMSKDGQWDEFIESLTDITQKILKEKEEAKDGEKSRRPTIIELPQRH